MIEISEKLSCSLRFVGMLLLCSLGAVVLAPPATAATVYTYSGNPFTSFDGTDGCTAGVGECQISLSFTIASPLPRQLWVSVCVYVSGHASVVLHDGWRPYPHAI